MVSAHELTTYLLQDTSIGIQMPERRVEAHGRIDQLNRQIELVQLARG